MRVWAVIDTNVVVSAIMARHADSAVVKVLEAVFDGRIVPVIHADILKEYREVLARRKFGFSPDKIAAVIDLFESAGEKTMPMHSDDNVPDPKDRIFYEVVLSKRNLDAKLVTGNKAHFPIKPFIVSAAEMVALLEGN